MYSEKMTFERVRKLLPNNGWDGKTHKLPNLVTRRGTNYLYGQEVVQPDTLQPIGNFGPRLKDWYFETFQYNPKYRFAGWAKVVNVFSFGMPDFWGEQLVPFDWYLSILAFPHETYVEWLPKEQALAGKKSETNFILQYADAVGMRYLTVGCPQRDFLLSALGGLEDDTPEPVAPRIKPHRWEGELDDSMRELVSKSFLTAAPYIIFDRDSVVVS